MPFLDKQPRPSSVGTLALGVLASIAIMGAGFYAFRAGQGLYLSAGLVEGPNGFFSGASGAALGMAMLFGLLVGFSP